MQYILYDFHMSYSIYDLEARLKTPEKFLHPKYERLVWFAAKGLQEKFESE